MKKSIYELNKSELEELIKPKFRVNQILNWLYKKYVKSFDEMKNLPKDLITSLKESYFIDDITIAKVQESKDSTKKYLFKLEDSHTIEAVLLQMKNEIVRDGEVKREKKYTICLSSQIGCKVGCSFCYTAKGGFVRNLTVSEIIYQVLEIKRDNDIPETRSVNLVFMGMGEPLDNFENVVKAIELLSDKDSLCISKRRITISTSGISTKIRKLAELDLGVQVAISLHAVDDKVREELIPMNKAFNIASIIDAIREYPIDNRKRFMFEYLVIKDLNDDLESAKKLVKLLNKIKAKVNLILFNPHEGSIYQRPDRKKVVEFQEYLLSKSLICTIRESRGIDIDAACGQLREKETING